MCIRDRCGEHRPCFTDVTHSDKGDPNSITVTVAPGVDTVVLEFIDEEPSIGPSASLAAAPTPAPTTGSLTPAPTTGAATSEPTSALTTASPTAKPTPEPTPAPVPVVGSVASTGLEYEDNDDTGTL